MALSVVLIIRRLRGLASSSSGPTDGILTESGDFLITEAGDFIVQE
jgi:hypothetical protein